MIYYILYKDDDYIVFRWEDGNNLTSNLQQTNIHKTYMYAHINLTQKKNNEKK